MFIPSWELTYPLKAVHFEDDFPFSCLVGYVNFLEGKSLWIQVAARNALRVQFGG